MGFETSKESMELNSSKQTLERISEKEIKSYQEKISKLKEEAKSLTERKNDIEKGLAESLTHKFAEIEIIKKEADKRNRETVVALNEIEAKQIEFEKQKKDHRVAVDSDYEEGRKQIANYNSILSSMNEKEIKLESDKIKLDIKMSEIDSANKALIIKDSDISSKLTELNLASDNADLKRKLLKKAEAHLTELEKTSNDKISELDKIKKEVESEILALKKNILKNDRQLINIGADKQTNINDANENIKISNALKAKQSEINAGLADLSNQQQVFNIRMNELSNRERNIKELQKLQSGGK